MCNTHTRTYPHTHTHAHGFCVLAVILPSFQTLPRPGEVLAFNQTVTLFAASRGQNPRSKVRSPDPRFPIPRPGQFRKVFSKGEILEKRNPIPSHRYARNQNSLRKSEMSGMNNMLYRTKCMKRTRISRATSINTLLRAGHLPRHALPLPLRVPIW